MSPRVRAPLPRPRTAACNSSPTRTNRLPLSRYTDSDRTPPSAVASAPTPGLAHDEPAHHDGQHAGGVDRLGEQERGEGGQDDGHVFLQRVVQMAADPHREPRGHHPGHGPAAVGEHEQPPDVRQAQVLVAYRDAHGQCVDDQGGTVVNQAFGAQYGQGAAGQSPGEHPHGRRVGRRHRRPEHPGRPPGQPQVVRHHRHRPGEHRQAQDHDEFESEHGLPPLAVRILPSSRVLSQPGQAVGGRPPPRSAGRTVFSGPAAPAGPGGTGPGLPAWP